MSHVSVSMIRLLTLGLALSLSSPAMAQEVTEPSSERVPLSENFSPLEYSLTGVMGAGAIFYITMGDSVLGGPTPSMGDATPGSIDWRFTHWANPEPNPERKWLGGAPDLGGYLAPVFTLGLYGAGWALQSEASTQGDFFHDTRHELFAYAGALAWTMTTVNTLKYMVGRRRPFLARPDLDPAAFEVEEREENLSFPSGHSASAAVTMTFLFLDISDYLVHDVLRDDSAWLQWGVGYIAPFLLASGLTWTVMYSRVKDQKHWLSDTVTGALIGSGFATLFYVLHFDREGNPRRRFPNEDDSALDTTADTLMIAPAMSPEGRPLVSLGFQF